ncbi:hypothetical protein [Anianabacter salinae]|uniref:hypothetical protein n=1 Tax=Anianabacter salinae TaxID=2851023 RepID=UPI00225E5B78|nr:hypothetical protein [Anianabacter salinae]MBV0911477.1 hypothetical protein [Anianabacter salinae]
MDLAPVTIAIALISAALWFYACKTVSRKQELARRIRAAAPGEQLDRGGVEIVDGQARYDLIATLRHQARWNRFAALFTALALIAQAVDPLV